MQLIGMLDSPYVRRVAIALRLLGLPFVHRPISVFRQFDEFARLSPVVKAPSLVCDDGGVLLDSTLMLTHLEDVAGRSLAPRDPAARLHDLRLAGLALTACEKSVQMIYEAEQRPEPARHAPWVARLRVQQQAALRELESALAHATPVVTQEALTGGVLAVAVTWRFLHLRPATAVPPTEFPALARLSEAAEALPAFAATPPDESADVSTPIAA